MDLSSTVFLCIAITTPLIVLFVISQKPPVLMTVIVSRNPGNLTHQECNGGAVTLARGHSNKSSVTCNKCEAHAEFDPVHANLFRFIKEDGKDRKFRVSHFRDNSRHRREPVKKGRILLATH